MQCLSVRPSVSRDFTVQGSFSAAFSKSLWPLVSCDAVNFHLLQVNVVSHVLFFDAHYLAVLPSSNPKSALHC